MSKPMSKPLAIVILLVFSLGLGIVGISVANAIGSGTFGNRSTSDPSGWPPQVGTKYVLGSRANETGCVSTSSTLDAALDAAEKHDDVGYQEAMMGAIELGQGTHVVVLDYDAFKGYLHVRATSGDNAGTACWMGIGSDNNGLIERQL